MMDPISPFSVPAAAARLMADSSAAERAVAFLKLCVLEIVPGIVFSPDSAIAAIVAAVIFMMLFAGPIGGLAEFPNIGMRRLAKPGRRHPLYAGETR